MAHLVGQRWQDDDGLWVVVAHGTRKHKGSWYKVAWYHRVGDRCPEPDEIDAECECSTQSEVAKWVANCPPTDCRFPNSLVGRAIGLRTHPMGWENGDSPFWVQDCTHKFRAAAEVAMNWLERQRAEEPGALAVMMSGATTVLADLANEIHKKLRYELLREPAEDEPGDFLNYGISTKEVFVQHESFAVLRAVMYAAGLYPDVRKRRVTAWLLAHPDALTRLLGVSSTKTGVNGLVRMWTFSREDLLKLSRDQAKRRRVTTDYSTRLNDPMAASDKEIYDAAEEELGENGAAGAEDGTVLPAWLLRHRMQENMIATNDPRVFAHAKVCHDKPGSVFELLVRPRVLPGPKGANAQFNGGFLVRARSRRGYRGTRAAGGRRP